MNDERSPQSPSFGFAEKIILGTDDLISGLFVCRKCCSCGLRYTNWVNIDLLEDWQMRKQYHYKSNGHKCGLFEVVKVDKV